MIYKMENISEMNLKNAIAGGMKKALGAGRKRVKAGSRNIKKVVKAGVAGVQSAAEELRGPQFTAADLYKRAKLGINLPNLKGGESEVEQRRRADA